MKKLLPLLFLLLPLAAFADDTTPADRPDVQELLTVARMQQTSDSMMDRIKPMMDQAIQRATASMGANGAALLTDMEDKMSDLVKSEMGWDKMKDEYAKVFAAVYTPDDTKKLIEFYKSPTGQMFLDRQPLLLQKTMEMSQARMMEMMPKIQAMIQGEAAKAGAGGGAPPPSGSN